MALPPNQGRTGIIARARHLAFFAVTGSLLSLIVCVHILSGCVTPTPKPAPAPAPYPENMPAEVIADEIAGTEKALSEITDEQPPGQKPGLFLRLAMLYAHPDNPDRNYSRAIDYLEQYMKLGKTVDAEFTLSLLTRLSKCQIVNKKACAELADRNEEIEKNFQALARENLQLKQMIEKLKHLDIQLEKKRKAF